jgi:hypothetical protein
MSYAGNRLENKTHDSVRRTEVDWFFLMSVIGITHRYQKGNEGIRKELEMGKNVYRIPDYRSEVWEGVRKM